MMKVDILVLNYNRKDLLGLFLPSICSAAKRSLNVCKVWVVDNVSTDGSVEFVKKNFPAVNIFSAESNKVLFSYNDVVKGLDSDIVIFLNNDIKVKEDFIDPLVSCLSDERMFFAAPCVLNMDGTYNGGKSHFEFKWGVIKSVVDSASYQEAGPTQMISCGAFKRDIFIKLGGFDSLYSPGIWEDSDLCYRALKNGYKGCYEPRSVIWHDESTTFKKVYGVQKKMALAHRNMLLFFWKNIDDAGMICFHILMIIPLILVAALRNNRAFIIGFFRALPKLKSAIERRPGFEAMNKNSSLKDKDLILWKFQ